MRLKVVKSKILDKGPVPKKAKVSSSITQPSNLQFLQIEVQYMYVE